MAWRESHLLGLYTAEQRLAVEIREDVSMMFSLGGELVCTQSRIEALQNCSLWMARR
jgi:hypothetical protein